MIKPEYQDMENRQMVEMIKKYPNIKLKDKSMVLRMVKDDLFAISNLGRIELIDKAEIVRYKHKKKVKYELEIKDSILIDVGMKAEEMIL